MQVHSAMEYKLSKLSASGLPLFHYKAFIWYATSVAGVPRRLHTTQLAVPFVWFLGPKFAPFTSFIIRPRHKKLSLAGKIGEDSRPMTATYHATDWKNKFIFK